MTDEEMKIIKKAFVDLVDESKEELITGYILGIQRKDGAVRVSYGYPSEDLFRAVTEDVSDAFEDTIENRKFH